MNPQPESLSNVTFHEQKRAPLTARAMMVLGLTASALGVAGAGTVLNLEEGTAFADHKCLAGETPYTIEQVTNTFADGSTYLIFISWCHDTQQSTPQTPNSNNGGSGGGGGTTNTTQATKKTTTTTTPWVLLDDDSDFLVNGYDPNPNIADSDGDGLVDGDPIELADQDGDNVQSMLVSNIVDLDNDATPDYMDVADNDPCVPNTNNESCENSTSTTEAETTTSATTTTEQAMVSSTENTLGVAINQDTDTPNIDKIEGSNSKYKRLASAILAASGVVGGWFILGAIRRKKQQQLES